MRASLDGRRAERGSCSQPSLVDPLVGELCRQRPLALVILRRRGIDPSQPAEASVLAGVLDEVRAAEARLAAPWRDRPVTELLDHVLRSYHRPFAAMVDETRAALAAAGAMREVAGGTELERQLAELGADMAQHMDKEERVLFPWLRGRADTAAAAIRAMQLEHSDTLGLLLAVQVTSARALERSGGPLAAAAAQRLEELERSLCEHIHLENNELFPRALEASTR